jgi:hypothetical protein
MRARIGLVFIFQLALILQAGAATFNEKTTNLQLPDAIGAWQRRNVIRFPDKQLGVEIDYQNRDGAIAAFYVYNRGLARIPTGAENSAVKKEFGTVQQEMLAIVTSRFTEVSKLLESHPTIKGTGKKATLSVAAYQFREKPKGRRHLSWLLISGYKNQFLKLRYTHSFDRGKPDFDRGQVDLKQLVTGFLDKNADNIGAFWM